MKKDDIDKLITESLSKDEAEFYKTLEEENVFKMWSGIYSGKNSWIAIILSILIIVFVFSAFYSGYRFFTEETVVGMLRYGAGMFIGLILTAFLKLWLWNQMDKNAIIRELKRIEFQVALLMEKNTDD
jgi:predicted small integral membrane protein